MITIAVDAMGGDHAPQAVVSGCLEALKAFDDISLILCGPESEIKALLPQDASRIEVLDAPEVITNHEHPTTAIRRKTNSSLVRAMDLVKQGKAQAVLSAGSTGAVLAGSIFRIGRIRGIERPALATTLPTVKGSPVLLLDCGANVDCKPAYLANFALMGSVYMKGVMEVAQPKVGLINIGAEAEKGNDLTKSAYPLLSESPVNFIGNVEARDVLSGVADVLVCDGFAGNMLIKHTEGMASSMMQMMKESFMSTTRSKIGALLLKPALKSFKKRLDYTEYGGAPLLGVNTVVIKAHGSSNAKAIASAVRQARQAVKGDIVGAIGRELSLMAENE